MSDPTQQGAAPTVDVESGFSDLYDLVNTAQASPSVDPANPPSSSPMLEAGSRSFIEGAGATAGLAAGVKAGLPFVGTPFVGPAIPVVTGIGGMLAGAYAGSQAAEGAFGLRSAEQMPPEQRSRAIFGENVGAGLGMMAPVYSLANTTARFAEAGVGKYLNSILEAARMRPATFGAVEVSGSVSAGLAGAGAQEAAPDQPLVRAGLEITAGVLNPVWRMSQMYDLVRNTFVTAQSKYSASAQQNLIGKQIIAAMNEAGEDPELVVRALKQQMPEEYERLLTAGQKSGSSVLIGFERGLYEHSGKFGNDAREKTEAVMDLMKVQIGMLAMSGDPKALTEIAKLRQAKYELLITTRLEAGSTEAAMAISRISRGGVVKDKGVFSVTARNAINRVYQEVRSVENDLWSNVKTNVDVPLSNILRARQELLDSTGTQLRNQVIPSYLERAIKEAEDARGQSFDYDPETFVITESDRPSIVSSIDLISYRKQIGDELAAAANNNQDERAYQLKKLHDAILDDLESVYSKMGDDAYNEARGFSKAKHDVFTRSFVGISDGTTRTGDKMPAELMLERAFAGGPVAADIKLRDLERASRFLEERGLGSAGALDTMLDTQEQFYRVVTAASLNKDGRIDPARVRDYISKNSVLLNRAPFNEIKTDLLEAIKSEDGLRRLENMAKNRNADVGRNSAFAQIAKVSDPISYASRILVSTRDQEKQLVSMFNLAKKGGGGYTTADGVRSARATVIGAAMNRAMRNDGQLDLEAFRGLLFTPNIAGQKPVIGIMLQEGIVDTAQVRNLQKMFDVLDNVAKTRTLGQPTQIDPGVGEIGLILAAKITGSKLTTAAQGATGASGSQLIVHAAVANAVEKMVSKIPQAKTKDMAVLLFNDPKMLALVLERNLKATPAEQMVKARQLNAWFIQSGLVNPALSYADAQGQQEPTQPTLFTLPQ